MVNTSFMMGGALGLAILASIAASQTQKLLMLHSNPLIALNTGYQVAFFVGALGAALAAVLGAVFLRTNSSKPSHS